MKRVIAISLLFLFLTSNTTFSQLLRLPTLIHHYLEHVEWDNYTLIEFLNEHYASTINHPDDQHNDHENLPFKTLDCQTIQVLTLAPQSTFCIVQIIHEAVKTENIIRDQQPYSNAYLNNIWQPPRFS